MEFLETEDLHREALSVKNAEIARLRADAAAATAKLRTENERLRVGLRDLVEDDTRNGPEMRDVAAAILADRFTPAGAPPR